MTAMKKATRAQQMGMRARAEAPKKAAPAAPKKAMAAKIAKTDKKPMAPKRPAMPAMKDTMERKGGMGMAPKRPAMPPRPMTAPPSAPPSAPPAAQGMKKGGMCGYKEGGRVASRGDGIAKKGRTKGRFI